MAKDPYKIPDTPCPKCGCRRFKITVEAWAEFERGTFVAFEYGEEVIPVEPIDAICAECGTETRLED